MPIHYYAVVTLAITSYQESVTLYWLRRPLVKRFAIDLTRISILGDFRMAQWNDLFLFVYILSSHMKLHFIFVATSDIVKWAPYMLCFNAPCDRNSYEKIWSEIWVFSHSQISFSKNQQVDSIVPDYTVDSSLIIVDKSDEFTYPDVEKLNESIRTNVGMEYSWCSCWITRWPAFEGVDKYTLVV